MDPNATWDDIQAAIYEGQAHEAVAPLEDLIEWVKKGGFVPPPLVTAKTTSPLYFLGLLKEACRQC